jgi:hypothetical protein
MTAALVIIDGSAEAAVAMGSELPTKASPRRSTQARHGIDFVPQGLRINVLYAAELGFKQPSKGKGWSLSEGLDSS